MSTQTTTAPGGDDQVSTAVPANDGGATEETEAPSQETGNGAEPAETSETVDENGAETVDPDEDGVEIVDPEDDGIVLMSVENTRIHELETSLSELQARLRAVSAAYKQQQDDMAAARERLARQALVKEEVRRGEVVATLFDPVQNLQRSIDAARKGAKLEDMVLGLEMLKNQFLEAFKSLGLEEVPGQGTRFNPNLHEALSMVPVEDASLDGVVIEVFSAGYRLGSRLITPARVIVGQKIEPEVVEDAATPEPAETESGDAAESESAAEES